MSAEGPERPFDPAIDPPALNPEPEDFDVELLYSVDDSSHRSTLTVPLWLSLACGMAFFLAGGYLTSYSGNFDNSVYSASLSSGKTTASASVAAPEPLEKQGEKIFKANCVQCHQANGMGQPGQYPPLVGADYVIGGEKRLAMILLYGLHGPIEVLGATYNNNMPAWSGTLNDQKIAAVGTYIRQAWGNKVGPLDPEKVKVLRSSAGNHPQMTKELLDAIPHDENL